MQQETGELLIDAHYYYAIIQPAGYNKPINLYPYSLPSIIVHIARGVFNMREFEEK